MTDDDSVHADDFGTRDHPELTGVRASRLAQASPKTARYSPVGRTQDDENALAALQSADSGRARGLAIVADDQIDGAGH